MFAMGSRLRGNGATDKPANLASLCRYGKGNELPGLLPLLSGLHIRACSSLINGFPPELSLVGAEPGMTLRSFSEVCNFDFFTRSFAGMMWCRNWPLGIEPAEAVR